VEVIFPILKYAQVCKKQVQLAETQAGRALLDICTEYSSLLIIIFKYLNKKIV
jgi:hypothetical protein